MTEDGKKQLFFVTSPQQDLRSVSAFLSKRNFKVHIEFDLREAIVKLIELQPEFIFLAWDHSDKKISSLPKLIAQATTATVVPFIATNTNEAIIKFSNCPINPKIFPPLSGPAIERLILKSNKLDSDQLARQILINAKIKTKEDLIQLQQKIMENLELEAAQEQETASQDPLQLEANVETKSATDKKFMIQKGFQATLGPGVFIQKGTLPTHDKGVREKLKYRAYCISLFTGNWCGYFVVATKAPMSFDTINLIFADWIKLQVSDNIELKKEDFFEFENIQQLQLSEIQLNADYTEKLNVEDYSVDISFFSVDPALMQLEFTEDKNYIKVKTEDIPVGVKMDFNLFIYLPENKKFLLYTQENSPLRPEQKDRLYKNKIEVLYLSSSFEANFRKFVARKVFDGIYKKLGKKFSTI